MLKHLFIAIVICICIGGTILLAQASDSSDTKLIKFQLKDQFNREYTHESWRDSIIVLIGSDRDGSDYNRKWAIAIQDSLHDDMGAEKMRFVAVADLRGVPFFLKSIVRGFFPKDDRRLWILLDWGGDLAKLYEFQPKKSNILIFNRDQALIKQFAVTELSPSPLDSILTTLRSVFKN